MTKDEDKRAEVDVKTVRTTTVICGRLDGGMEGKEVDVWVGVDGAIVEGSNSTFNGVVGGVFSEFNSDNVGSDSGDLGK